MGVKNTFGYVILSELSILIIYSYIDLPVCMKIETDKTTVKF